MLAFAQPADAAAPAGYRQRRHRYRFFLVPTDPNLLTVNNYIRHNQGS